MLRFFFWRVYILQSILLQKHVARIKFDIYVFISLYYWHWYTMRASMVYLLLCYLIFILLYKSSNKTILIFYGKLADEWDNPVDNSNIYNVKEDNRLSPGIQPLTTGSVVNICFLFRNFSSTKQNIRVT
jgi:hypothetical protein